MLRTAHLLTLLTWKHWQSLEVYDKFSLLWTFSSTLFLAPFLSYSAKFCGLSRKLLYPKPKFEQIIKCCSELRSKTKDQHFLFDATYLSRVSKAGRSILKTSTRFSLFSLYIWLALVKCQGGAVLKFLLCLSSAALCLAPHSHSLSLVLSGVTYCSSLYILNTDKKRSVATEQRNAPKKPKRKTRWQET